MRRLLPWLLLLAPAVASSGPFDGAVVTASYTLPPSPQAAQILANAEGYLGVPYRWNGRDTKNLPGLDCLGLLYRAYGPVTDTPWTAYPVNPSELVASGLLGEPVHGTPVLRPHFNESSLRPGDVLYFLIDGYEIEDEPLWERGEAKFWPWHVAIYAGQGEVLHAAPGDVVRRQRLDEVLWDALLATRLTSPQ